MWVEVEVEVAEVVLLEGEEKTVVVVPVVVVEEGVTVTTAFAGVKVVSMVEIEGGGDWV